MRDKNALYLWTLWSTWYTCSTKKWPNVYLGWEIQWPANQIWPVQGGWMQPDVVAWAPVPVGGSAWAKVEVAVAYQVKADSQNLTLQCRPSQVPMSYSFDDASLQSWTVADSKFNFSSACSNGGDLFKRYQINVCFMDKHGSCQHMQVSSLHIHLTCGGLPYMHTYEIAETKAKTILLS